MPEELSSNWSSGLTIWDWLHGTLRLNVPQNHLTIGVAAYPDAKEPTYPKLIEAPFDEQRYPAWVRADGAMPRPGRGPAGNADNARLRSCYRPACRLAGNAACLSITWRR